MENCFLNCESYLNTAVNIWSLLLKFEVLASAKDFQWKIPARVYSTCSLNSGEYILIERIYDIVFIKEILGFIQTSVSDSAQSNTEAIYEPRIILNPGKREKVLNY